MAISGSIRKLTTRFDTPVSYALPVGAELVPMNERIGAALRLEFSGEISCIACGRTIKKSFAQGYCFPCFRGLPETDGCIVRPETCHFAKGTCRDPAWGELNCMRPHTVYLANSSGVKIGITRGLDPIGRWIDQGAVQGLAIRKAKSRFESGLIEIALKAYVSDKTDWRKMLRGVPEVVDLAQERERLLNRFREEHPEQELFGEPLPNAQQLTIAYPVLTYPKKILSHNFDKSHVLEGTLLGIKGQYLIFDTAVVNLRTYAGYHLTLA